jgi:hypothetical protein
MLSGCYHKAAGRSPREFKDRDGRDHTVEYFEVVSFSPEAMDPGILARLRKAIFTAFDGMP